MNALKAFKALEGLNVHMSPDVDIFDLGEALTTRADTDRPDAKYMTCDYSSFDSTVSHPLMLLIAYGLRDLFDYVLDELEFRMQEELVHVKDKKGNVTIMPHYFSHDQHRKALFSLIFNQETVGRCKMASY